MILMQGDCLVEMFKIPDDSVDLIIADLPYGSISCSWDILIPFKHLWEHYWRVLKSNGVVLLFGSEPFSTHLRMSQIKNYKYDWVWVKNTSTGICNSKFMPLKNYELISCFSLQSLKRVNFYPQPTKRFSKESIIRSRYKMQSGNSNHTSCGESLPPKQYNSEFGNPRMVIEFKTDPNSKGKLHPTQKPVSLLEYLIKTYTSEGDTVLDNVMGSGSTGIAAINTNRDFIGIEMNENYFELAKNRIFTKKNERDYERG